MRNVECGVLSVEWLPEAMLSGALCAILNVECWVLNVELSALPLARARMLNSLPYDLKNLGLYFGRDGECIGDYYNNLFATLACHLYKYAFKLV